MPTNTSSYPESSILAVGQIVSPGNARTSPDNQYTLSFESGTLMLGTNNGQEVWCLALPAGKAATYAALQDDGDLVLLDAQDRPVWRASDNGGKRGAQYRDSALYVTNEGNLVVHHPNGGVVWSRLPAQAPIASFPAASTLRAGESLIYGQSRTSPNGTYVFRMNNGETFTLFGANNAALASLGDMRSGVARIFLQDDGDLVVYDGYGNGYWQASVNGRGKTGPECQGSHLRVTDDGNLVVHAPNGGVVWSLRPALPAPATIQAPAPATIQTPAPTTIQAPAPAPTASFPAGSTLAMNEPLLPGASRTSPNGVHKLIYQTDGNLVLYGANSAALWASNTWKATTTKTVLQEDGDLVVINAATTLIWRSSANGGKTGPAYRGSHLRVTDDGNLVIHAPDGTVVWSRLPAQPIPAQAPVAPPPVPQAPVAQAPVAPPPVAQAPVAQAPVAPAPVAPPAPQYDVTTWSLVSASSVGSKPTHTGTLEGTFAAVVGFTAGTGQYVLFHRPNGEWFIRGVGMDGKLQPEVLRGQFNACYRVLLAQTQPDGTCWFYGHHTDQTWRMWQFDQSGLRDLANKSGKLDKYYPTLIAHRSDFSSLIGIGADGKVQWLRGNQGTDNPLGVELRTVAALADGIVGQDANGRVTLWRFRYEEFRRHASFELGSFHPILIPLFEGVRCNLLAVRADGTFTVYSADDDGAGTEKAKGQLGEPPSAMVCIAHPDSRYSFFLSTTQKTASRPPGFPWLVQTVASDGRLGGAAGLGVVPRRYPVELCVAGDTAPLLFGHGEGGEWTITELPTNGAPAAERAAGKWSKHYAVVVPYTVRGAHYLLAHAKDGAWMTLARTGTSLAPTTSSDRWDGFYPVLCVYEVDGRVFCRGQRGDGRWVIRELLADGKIGAVTASGEATRDWTFISFMSGGKRHALTMNERGLTTYTLPAGGGAPQLVAFETHIRNKKHVLRLPDVAGRGRFLYHERHSWQAVDLVDGGRRWLESGHGSSEVAYSQFMSVEVAGRTLLVGLADEDTPISPLRTEYHDTTGRPRLATSTPQTLPAARTPAEPDVPARRLSPAVLEATLAALRVKPADDLATYKIRGLGKPTAKDPVIIAPGEALSAFGLLLVYTRSGEFGLYWAPTGDWIFKAGTQGRGVGQVVIANSDIQVQVGDQVLWSWRSIATKLEGGFVFDPAQYSSDHEGPSRSHSRNHFTLKMTGGKLVVLHDDAQGMQRSDAIEGPDPHDYAGGFARDRAAIERRISELEAELWTRDSLNLGVVMGGGSFVDIPGVTLPNPDEIILQLWVHPLQLATDIFWMNGGPFIRAEADGAIRVVWRGKDFCTPPGAVKIDEWLHLGVVFGDGGYQVYLDGVAASSVYPKTTFVPLPGVDNGPFLRIGGGPQSPGSVAIGEVRLWNRVCDAEVVLDRAMSPLRGDEVGLMGWWTLDDPAAARIVDRSPFGRHGARVGTFREGPLLAYATGSSPPALYAATFTGTSALGVDPVALSKPGFTWQAWVELADETEATLLELSSEGRTLTISSKDGVLRFKIAAEGKTTMAGTGETATATWSCPRHFTPGRGTSLTVRLEPNLRVTYFVDGRRVEAGPLTVYQPRPTERNYVVDGKLITLPIVHGDADLAAFFSADMRVTVGQGLRGRMAELRLWSRPLADGDIGETWRRRIHGWAPGLAVYLRLDEARAPRTLQDATLERRNTSRYALGEPRPHAWIDPAPPVPIPRALHLGPSAVDLTRRTRLSGAALSIQMWTKVEIDRAPLDQELFDANYEAGNLHQRQPRASQQELADASARITRAQQALLDQYDLLRLTSGTSTWLSIRCSHTGTLTLRFQDASGGTQDMQVRKLLKPSQWAHLTLTIDARGFTCIYLNGALIAREQNAPLTAALRGEFTTTLGGPLRCAFTELRLWERALSQTEIERFSQRKLASSPGLALRAALDGDWSEVPHVPCGDSRCAVEEPRLALSENGPPRRATVASFVELLADQSSRGKTPSLIMDLTALAADGATLADVELTLVASEDARLYRTVELDKNAFAVASDVAFTLKTDASGKLRVIIGLATLSAPTFQIRHSGMGEGEWTIVSPDTAILTAIYGLTADELTGGRPASTIHKAQSPLLTADGAKLAAILKKLTGTAMVCRLERENTEALAFGADDEATPAAPLELLSAAPGVTHLAIPCGTRLVRRLGKRLPVTVKRAPIASADATGPQAFGWFDDVCDFFEDAAEAVVDGVTTAFEEVVEAGESVIDSVKIAVNTVIDGVKVFVELVARTVVEVADAVWQVLKAIGKTLQQVLAFLCALFDFEDFIETSDYLYAQFMAALDYSRRTSAGLLRGFAGQLGGIDATLTRAIGGRARGPADDGALSTVIDLASELMSPLNWLLSLIQEPLLDAFKSLLPAFKPALAAVDTIKDQLGRLGTDVMKRFVGDLQTALGDPSRFVSDPSVLLDLAQAAIGVVMTTLQGGVGLAAQVIESFLDVLKKALDTRIDIPVITWLLEKVTGRDLSILRVLCHVAAIPVTLIYKTVHATTDGPFNKKKAMTFADQSQSVDLALRALDTFVLMVYTPLDVMGAVDDEIADNQGLKLARYCVDLYCNGVIHHPGLEALMKGEDPPKPGTTKHALVYSAYALNMISLPLLLHSMVTGNKVTDKMSGTAGALAGVLTSIQAGFELVEEPKPLAACDLVKESALAVSGFAGTWLAGNPAAAAVYATNMTALVASLVGAGLLISEM